MSFDLMNMWRSMGPFAKFIAIVLAIMSVWSLAVAVERIITYSRAGSASRKYAAELATLLPAGKFKEAVELAHSKEFAKGYLPKVLGLALEEYRQGIESHGRDGGKHEIGEFDIVAAVNRAIDRSTLRTITDMRRGLGSLATIGSTAPFVGLLGTVAGIITAFQAMAATGSGGLGLGLGRHRRGARDHRLRPARRHPGRHVLQLLHQPGGGDPGRRQRLHHRARRLHDQGRALGPSGPRGNSVMSMDVGSKGVKSDINVTPLVDVVLVLLIIFMVITPMLQRGKAVTLPDAKLVSELKSGGDPIILSVTRDGKTYIEKEEVKKDDLAPALEAAMAKLPGAPIMFKGDRDADYKVIREAILEVTKTRVMGVSLAASQLKDETDVKGGK